MLYIKEIIIVAIEEANPIVSLLTIIPITDKQKLINTIIEYAPSNL